MRYPEEFFRAFEEAHKFPWVGSLQNVLKEVYSKTPHGDTPKWEKAMNMLPSAEVLEKNLGGSYVGCALAEEPKADALKNTLMAFHPWRKGPFRLGEVTIDTEWRSDWKWDRLKDSLEPLSGQAVLDIGCGSGYHIWRMLGAGARWAVGVEPVEVYVYQFACLQHFLGYRDRCTVLGIPFESFPQGTHFFDTVFSMGVLYHRKSPLEHLESIRESTVPGGQVVLETLVIDGDQNTLLFPDGRYSQMRNVWFLPSVKMLVQWMKRLRFLDVEVVDVTRTSFDEQRSTEWMNFDSLEKFVDPDDKNQTVEGYPGPLRAIIKARVGR